MMKKIILFIFILNFVFCSLVLSKDVSAAKINLYVISFDNIKGDPEMDWLKEGFVDFIQNHFNYISGVEVYRTDILDETIKAKREKKISGTKDFILSGGFKKEKGSIIVGLQLIDMNTYLPVELQEVTEPSHDLAKIVESVNSTVDKMLKPYVGDLFEAKVEKSFEEIKKISKKPTIGKISGRSETTKNISLALDNLEKSYSEFISPSQEVKIIRKQDKNIFSRSVKESIIQTTSLREVIENIVSNPYKVEIGEPVIKRTPLFPDKVALTVNILFHLSREIIR